MADSLNAMSTNERYATVGRIVDLMGALWPWHTAESWDAVGFAVGDRRTSVRRILFAVDPVLQTVEEARDIGAELIVTHHPLLLRGIHAVDAADDKGAVIQRLVKAGIGLVNAHTNADIAAGGVSETLADAVGVQGYRPLIETAGSVERGETASGPGRVGELAESVTLAEFAARVAEVLPATAGGIRVAGPRSATVRTVAVCGGAGDGYLDLVEAGGADVYVTSDLRHHPAIEARERAIASGSSTPYLIDTSHWASESLWLMRAADTIVDELSEQGITVETTVSETSTDPWTFRLPTGE